MGEYQSPGGAFTNGMESFLMARQAQARQAMLDSITQRKEAANEQHMQLEDELAREALAEKRREADQTMTDREAAQFDKRVGTMMRGDIPDAAMLAADDKHGRGYFQPLEPGGPRVFAGTIKEREKIKTDKNVKDIMDKLATVTPGSPDDERLRVLYEMTTGKQLLRPAAAPRPTTKPILRASPDRKVVQQLQDGQWVPVSGDVDANALMLPEPQPKDTSAGDARKATQYNQVHEQAVKELDTWAKPIQGHIDGINELGTMLAAKTPQADTLIAPLVLKATVSGTGSGFRMTRAEIENVVGGRSKWESLQAALNKWSTDPSKALSITDPQREELRTLAKTIRTKANALHQKIIKARHDIDDADDAAGINKVRTWLQEELAASTDDSVDTPAGLPAVGGTFNGGKVLAIRPK